MKRTLSVLTCVGILVGMSSPAAARGSFYEWWTSDSSQSDQLIDAIRERLRQYLSGLNGGSSETQVSDNPRPASPTPEPSSALVFGAGLLVASQIARKRRR